jgi:hypothetical protein
VVKSLHEGFIVGSIGSNIGSISSGASAFGGISHIGHLIIEHGHIMIFKVLVVGRWLGGGGSLGDDSVVKGESVLSSWESR